MICGVTGSVATVVCLRRRRLSRWRHAAFNLFFFGDRIGANIHFPVQRCCAFQCVSFSGLAEVASLTPRRGVRKKTSCSLAVARVMNPSHAGSVIEGLRLVAIVSPFSQPSRSFAPLVKR